MAADGAEGWKAPRRRGGSVPKGEPAPAPAKAPAAANSKAKPLPTVNPKAVAAIVSAEHGDPFAVLGPHEVAPGAWEVRAMLPEARAAAVETDDQTVPMERRHEAGFFVARLEGRYRPTYRLRLEIGDRSVVREDPYRFGTCLTDEDVARLRDIGGDATYRKLGAHAATLDGVAGFNFAVWAPNARRVSVVGDFNDWDGRRLPMRLRHSGGVWELFVPGLGAGARYKYEIKGADGGLHIKADPVAFYAERPPNTASVLHGAPEFPWASDQWLQTRAAGDPRKKPISVYECHLGSWMRGEGNRYLTYRELAEKLIPYVRDMGFSHIELLPITEFPFDGSWGYQPVSLFAPTSRFGSPEDFCAFVEASHEAGIGLILDWVPGHFPNDPHGLGLFDGTHLYEHADPRQGYHQDWGTYIYNYGRQEVAAFLVANARFWLERYRLDGLRVDAVASMLYLDYSRKHGEWVPNRYGGNENLDAIDFLRRMNEVAYQSAPGVVTVAEESTAWPGVSHPTYTGGLGFGFKWNMGWMHDTLRFISKEPVHRRYHHHDLTFGLLYAFTENFILPLSHDEVVHGKGSLLGKMPGDRWQRFANLRAYLGFMWGHPGKKLLFMGGEFGQEREWNHDVSLDWHLLDDPFHRGLKDLVRDLNRAYRDLPALHERDCEAGGFQWLVSDDADNSVIAWARFGDEPGRVTVVVSNFTPVPRVGYRVGVPEGGFYREAVNTDAAPYGGSNMGNMGGVHAAAAEAHGRPWSLCLTLPPLATLVLDRQPG
ncbi:MAG TPA: 1,4-alpha-glucan branching protein GlgB [Beijerinckiaceae bacterium]|jgi:1,4-alpha-glucan branching enzyme